ncbi:MAG TPA: hypothetical protein VE110_09165 [Gemmatimonadaceae bacterium]|nr:hypothetical protein [Gemmatimonadaceae bacterium]
MKFLRAISIVIAVVMALVPTSRATGQLRGSVGPTAVVGPRGQGRVIWGQPPAIKAGERVRLTLSRPPKPRVEGKVGFISGDSISLRGVNGETPFALSDVALLEVRRRSGGSFVRSVAYGLLGGVVGGAAAGAARGNVNTGDGRISAEGNALLGAIGGGALGLVGGAVYGACCSSTWKAVPIPR